jgi:crotonobetainyl-CoA:carnitine CoA-transferase CaiB-like acyl-CoA transferase
VNATISPLAGLKVLDFSALLPGPFATHVLSDLGADVVRVEAPERPDLLRMLPPYVDSNPRKGSLAHATINRGKRSLALDLKQPESIAAIKRLIGDYDIVLESFRPGVMQRFGLDYASLKAINPRLVYCSLSGFGQNGPLRERGGHDINYLALSGAVGYSGDDQHGPALPGVQVADLGGALYAVVGILAAVVHRQRTGEGQYVDVSMTDAAYTLNALLNPGVLQGAPAPQPQGTDLNGGGFYGFYRTRDGRWFSVGSLELPFARALLQALGLDPALAPPPLDLAAGQAVKQRIADAFAQYDYAHWLQVFAPIDACVEPVLSLEEAAVHPQLIAREMVIEVPGPDGTTLRQPGCAIRFSQPLAAPKFTGATVGAHNDEILSSLSNIPTPEKLP